MQSPAASFKTSSSIILLCLSLLTCSTGKSSELPLIDAAREGRLSEVSSLLGENRDINERASTGTALIHAARQGHENIVRLLLEKGADPDLVSDKGLTALHVAAHGKHANIVTLLLDAGANPNIRAKSISGGTVLIASISKGDGNMAKLLLDGGADIRVADFNGYTPLHMAVKQDHLDIVEILLDYNAPLESKLKNLNLTPLLLSLTPRISEELKEFFSNLGISQEMINKHRDNPGQLLKMVPALIKKSTAYKDKDKERLYRDIAKIRQSLRASAPSIALRLIRIGADVNARTSLNDTPAIFAAGSGEIEVLRELIKYGANLESQNVTGYTPLFNSLGSSDRKIINLLLDKNVDTTSTIPGGKITVLEFAFFKEYTSKGSIGLEIIERLVKLEKRGKVLRRVKAMSIEARRDDITALIE